MFRPERTCLWSAPRLVNPINNMDVNLCGRCKGKVLTGLKCVICECSYHNSCAKISANVKIIDDNTIQCCEKEESELDIQSVDDVDNAFYVALDQISDNENKIDVRIFKYVLKQKDNLIKELQEKIKLLNQHVDLQSKHDRLKSNVSVVMTDSECAESGTTKSNDDDNVTQNNKLVNPVNPRLRPSGEFCAAREAYFTKHNTL